MNKFSHFIKHKHTSAEVRGQRSEVRGQVEDDEESGLVLGRIFISVKRSEYCQPVQLDHSTPSA